MSLPEKLNYNFVNDYMEICCDTLVKYGRQVSEEDGADNYYLVALTRWLSTSFEQTLASLTLFVSGAQDELDVCLWDHIHKVSSDHDDWRCWNALASVAVRLMFSGVSEAQVERLLSIQKHIQGYSMTNISNEGLTARLQLYGDRTLSEVVRSGMNDDHQELD